MKALISALLLLGSALGAAAQTAPAFTLNCQNGSWKNYKQRYNFCETRDLAFDAPSGQALAVDGGPNGGITVHGWDGPNVRVRAKVQAWGASEAAAQATAQRVVVGPAGNTLRATDPARATAANPDPDQSWSVSYELFVPRQTALALRTTNGGISLDNVQAVIRFEAVNGGVVLAGLGGQVSGYTTNGALSIDLTGRQWTGKGLDVQTTNGGISWKLPPDYSAQFFTSTQIGRITEVSSVRTDLAVTKNGALGREIVASLGKGGALVKAVTTNGGIEVVRGGE